MNIAEIRKKARQGKAEPQVSGEETLNDAVCPRAGTIVAESLPKTEKEPFPAVAVPVPPVAEVAAVNPVGSKDLLTAGEDRLDQLFSWVPQAEDLLLEGGASVAAGGKKVEAISRRWLAFSLGSEDYALDISMIREILKPREITEIPRVPDFLLGIISLRGNIIPIFDLKRRLGLGEATIDQDSRIIVCQEGDRLAGLLIDRITQVTSIQEEGIEPPPAIFSGRDRALLDGVGRVQGNVLILLNVANVLTIDSNGL
ncbi:MAG: purine-binding chemotaxis protein CheW [Desulfuromonadales bacterium]|nr:purine-binding chemotaxis protein CheW [Desulfuromonadales bacterium]